VLTGLDESLLHQTSTTFADVATSDHRFYDRCWVAAYDPGGDMALNMGLGVYKNMDVADGFCCVVRGSHQRNVRVSRTLRPRLDDSVVGPLRYEVIDPYRHVRVDLEPDGHGVGCHLDWRATLPPFVEDPTLTEINGRVATNVQRYDQTGTVDGWISLDGERIPVDGWFGARDHSWGVRAGVGGFEPATGSSPFADGFLVTWLLFRTPDLGGYVQLNRDGHGNETFKDGRLRFDDGRDDRVVCEVDQQVEFPSGSRWYRRASLQVTDDEGATYEMECERLSRPIVMRGAGYDGGFDDNQGLGVHRGNSVLEADAYDLSEDGHPRRLPDRTPMRSLQTGQPVSIVVNGSAGVGDLTVLAVGDLSRYGVPAAEGAAG
jgi:hypothetical protein